MRRWILNGHTGSVDDQEMSEERQSHEQHNKGLTEKRNIDNGTTDGAFQVAVTMTMNRKRFCWQRLTSSYSEFFYIPFCFLSANTPMHGNTAIANKAAAPNHVWKEDRIWLIEKLVKAVTTPATAHTTPMPTIKVKRIREEGTWVRMVG